MNYNESQVTLDGGSKQPPSLKNKKEILVEHIPNAATKPYTTQDTHQHRNSYNASYDTCSQI